MTPSLPPAVSGERFEFDSGAGRLSGYAAGPAHGIPLLLVHSVNAAASVAEVRPLFEHARAQRPVYALDLPGFGFSERSDRAYTPRLMTDALHAAVAQIARRHSAIAIDAMALSLSCEFLARAAAEAPAGFRRLALVSPTGFSGQRRRRGPPGSTLAMPWLHAAFTGPGWGGALFRQLTRPGVVRYFLRRTFGRAQIDEALWRYCVLSAQQPGAEHAPLHFLSASLFSKDINNVYESLQQPVWMSHGVRGDFVDYRGKDTVEDRANWRFSVFDTGALPYFEKPAEFCAGLDHFLA
ncbi:MAG TPA: alpha/beta fold hydrolase [Rubrivivax sp.]